MSLKVAKAQLKLHKAPISVTIDKVKKSNKNQESGAKKKSREVWFIVVCLSELRTSTALLQKTKVKRKIEILSIKSGENKLKAKANLERNVKLFQVCSIIFLKLKHLPSSESCFSQTL